MKKIILVSLIVLILLFNTIVLIYILPTNTEDKQSQIITDPLLNQNSTSPSPTQEAIDEFSQELFLVTKVIDGDTIEIENSERVRLICIDSLEQGEEGYNESKKYLEDLVLNKKVRLEKDISERDNYQRLVRYVYLEDRTFVNELIAKQGYAKAYWYEPDITLCPIIQKAEDYAKENNLGIWKITEDKNNDEASKEDNAGESETIQQENYNCTSNIYNCGDFLTHEKAQDVFEFCGGVSNDIHRLDSDKDGVACEGLM